MAAQFALLLRLAVLVSYLTGADEVVVEVAPRGVGQLLTIYQQQPLVREVLDLNDRLRGMGLGAQFDFPAIVVIGDQSAGKSSVLEAISGVPLLRGAGVVTRAPVELRLARADSDCTARIKAHGGVELRVPCAEVGAAMNATMRLLPGAKNGGVTDTVIRVRVTARDVPDLTLVDLPGLARVATEGQSKDVPALTKRLISKYIAPRNTIILVVVPCTADLATAEALQLAAEVDPEGLRTVGVLTKPDLMDPGTEHQLERILRGQIVNLPHHGYFVVRNRGQLALDANTSLRASLDEEEAFFNSHETFHKLVRGASGEQVDTTGQFGSPALVRYLTRLLVSRVTAEVPELRARVEERILAEAAALHALGARPPAGAAGAADRKAYLLQLTTDFTMAVRETTRGHYDMLARESESRGFMAELLALYRAFDDAVRLQAPNVNSSHYDADVRLAVATQHGRESFYGFPSYAIFATLVRDIVARTAPAAERCASLVRARVVAMARATSAQRFARRFPRLRADLDATTKQLADERHADAASAVRMLLDMQLQPFTQELLRASPRRRAADDAAGATDEPTADESAEPSLFKSPKGARRMGATLHTGAQNGAQTAKPTGAPIEERLHRTDVGADAPAPSAEPVWSSGGGDAHAYAVDFVKSKIERYFDILAVRLGDQVPMAVDLYLVQQFGHDAALRVANATHALDDDAVQRLLEEDSDLARRRRGHEDMLRKLQHARETLDDFANTVHSLLPA